MSKTILYNSKKSVSNADWKIIVLDDFTRRFVDYLSQKYNLPNFISPYLLFKEINLDDFDNFFTPKLKNPLTTCFPINVIMQNLIKHEKPL